MTTSSPEASSPEKYYNLHVTGLGYVNRIRDVPPKKGKRGAPFLACDINALVGPCDAPDHRRYDVRVSGKDALHLIRRCKPASDNGQKVLIGFRLGDPWHDIFTYKEGHPKAGQTGVSQKARLLFVSWIKVDGEEVYRAPSRTDEDIAREDSQEAGAEVPAVAA